MGNEKGDFLMRNTVLATAAAFALALSLTPSMAAPPRGGDNNTAQQEAQHNSGTSNQCATVLANRGAYGHGELSACQRRGG